MPRTESQKKLALVVRVSDVKGRDEKNGDRFISPELQVATATGYAAGKGYAVKRFTDLNVSHTTPLDDRPGMGEALRLIESGKLAGLVVSSQDRLGPLDITRELKKRLEAANAVLLCPDNPATENVAARGYSKLPGEQMALMHEAQREEIGLRWAKAKHSAFERGVYAGAAPAGYSKDDGKLVPDGNVHGAAVIAAFEARAEGKSFGVVARILSDAGVTTCQGRTAWTTAGARTVIQNDIYVGVVTCTCGCGESKEVENWKLIERALWLRANAHKPTQRKGSKGDGEGQMLNGLLKCATCGYGMSCDHSKHNGKAYRYYRCKANPACKSRSVISAEKIESHLLAAVLERVGTVHGEDAGVDEERISELRTGIKKAEADIAGLKTMLDSDEIDAMTYATANAAAVRTRDALAVELSEIEIDSVATKWYVPGPGDRDYIEGGEHTTAAVFERMPTSVKRQALGTVVAHATVAPGKGEAWERVELEWAA